MKLYVNEHCEVTETEVIIRCQEHDDEVENIITGIKSAAKLIIGENEKGDSCQLPVINVLYFEAVDGNVYAYLEQSVMRIKNTLYELEDSCNNYYFIRISKSVIVNLRTIKSIKPEAGRRLLIELKNKENLVVSKNYVSALKKALKMKEVSR